jgi:hypothetical protein
VCRNAVFDELASETWKDEEMGVGRDLIQEFHTMELGFGH